MTRDARARLEFIANKIDSPHADKIYVAKDYTKADLKRDILEAVALGTNKESSP